MWPGFLIFGDFFISPLKGSPRLKRFLWELFSHGSFIAGDYFPLVPCEWKVPAGGALGGGRAGVVWVGVRGLGWGEVGRLPVFGSLPSFPECLLLSPFSKAFSR